MNFEPVRETTWTPPLAFQSDGEVIAILERCHSDAHMIVVYQNGLIEYTDHGSYVHLDGHGGYRRMDTMSWPQKIVIFARLGSVHASIKVNHPVAGR